MKLDGDDLLGTLKIRFETNMHRHQGVAWVDVRARLESNPDALKALRAMEKSGGEPDVQNVCKQELGNNREGYRNDERSEPAALGEGAY